MVQIVQGPTKTLLASAAIASNLRLKITSGKWAVAGSTDPHVAISEYAVFAADVPLAGRLCTAEGTRFATASGAITAGNNVYAAASGKVAGSGTVVEGIALSGATADGDLLEILTLQTAGADFNKISAATDATAAVTTTATETAFDNSASIPANTLAAGDVIRVRCQGIATATNGADTLNIRMKIGSVTVAATGDKDVANSDIFYFDVDIVVRTIGAGGTIVAAGIGFIGTPGTPASSPGTVGPVFKASSTLDTTAAADITVTADWSSADAGNSCRMDVLDVEHLRA
jgi:hypothetical protein